MKHSAHRYFILNKPYNMVSQFVSSHEVNLLCNLPYHFPEGTHAIGRLDNHSEGLLLLTTNKNITRLLFQGAVPHQRTYLVQVRNRVSEEALQQLRSGVSIRVKGGGYYTTAPCEAAIVQRPADLYKSAYEYDETLPNTWLLISLTEGRFHQARKMVKALHHPCKRLIRVAIEDMTLDNLQPGEVREIPEAEFFSRLKLANG